MRHSAVRLETGIEEHFFAARSLYSRFGFTEGAPFGSCTGDPNNVYFGINLV